VLAVEFSPDGKTLASASYEDVLAARALKGDGPKVVGVVKLWDHSTGKLKSVCRGHTIYVYALAFSPNGQTLATGSFDSTGKLWDVATGREQATFRGHQAHIYKVAFSLDGKLLATASADRTVKVWDALMLLGRQGASSVER
jgi:WD40 repeat protein